MPELDICVGVTQDKRYHKWDVFHHCIFTCDNLEPNLMLRLGGLLHDIGKPITRVVTKDKGITFHKHEMAGVKLAKNLLIKLGYSNAIRKEILMLVRLHMYHYTREYTDGAIRRFIKKAGIFRGIPDTGKTTFMNLLGAFIGIENVSNVSLQLLAEGKWHLTYLYNKHSNICDDLSDKDITDSGTFKQVTGRSNIHAEYKFGDQFGFINFAKLSFACNKIPKINSDVDDDDEIHSQDDIEEHQPKKEQPVIVEDSDDEPEKEAEPEPEPEKKAPVKRKVVTKNKRKRISQYILITIIHFLKIIL